MLVTQEIRLFFGVGDVIEVVFDQDTNEVSVATKGDLDDILDLSTPLGTSYNGE